MLNRCILIVVLFISSLNGSSQIVKDTTRIRISCATSLSPDQAPLVLINNLESDLESTFLDPNNIKQIDVLKNKSATDRFGERAKNGVILITMKEGASFYTWADFINSKNDTATHQIKLNGKVLKDMKKLLIDKKAFVSTSNESNWQLDERCNLTVNATLNISASFQKN